MPCFTEDRTKNASPLSRLASVLLCLCLLAAPAAALNAKGQKNYKRGVEHEAAQQWEKAAEEFALAVASDPSNAEYQLHYRRALFNASQVFMQQGSTLLERGDYVGAYNAFRRSYGYDPANELARGMMERTLRMQLEKEGTDKSAPVKSDAAARLTPTAYDEGSSGGARPPRGGDEEVTPASPRTEQLGVITYSGDLEKFIKYLARQLKLNVVFDRDLPRRNVEVDLHEVTAAQALDYIFLTQGLFFQKLSNRTILVADQTKRPQYQQLVLRTFYLYNVDPNEAKQLIQASIPPQAGRQPVITSNKSTNSITVRDTPENVRLVGELLTSIDKERSEVVMDVQIYEVSRSDLMQFGNQIGGESSLLNLGGIQKGLSVLGGSREVVTQAVAAPTALGAALLVPATALSALQRKDTTRLVASTQVHAFDGEKSTAHIGQRVPVQTATVAPYGSVSTGDQKQQPGVAQGLFGGNGYPVIQYEKTGLTLEFTPQVFPNLDVQVKMSIKSNDVTQTAGGPALTPTFTERNIEGTARIQNNRTMMIASVAQNQQTRGRQGLPILGLVPVLGRFFTAPRNSDNTTDIIIAVTPRVMRAPSLTPRDDQSHPTGTLQTPNSDTLEAMLQEVSREEQLAAARALPRHARVELPDAEPQNFIPAPKELMNGTARPAETRPPVREAIIEEEQPAPRATPASHEEPSQEEPSGANSVRLISTAHETTAQESQAKPTQEPPVTNPPAPPAPAAPKPSAREVFKGSIAQPSPSPVSSTTEAPAASGEARSAAAFRLLSEPQQMRVGERRALKLLLKTDAPLGLVAASLRFDPRVVAVRSVRRGNAFDNPGAPLAHSVSPEGLLLVSVTPGIDGRSLTGAGVLLVVEVEAVGPGSEAFRVVAEDFHVAATDGRKVLVRVTADGVAVGR